jgi:hypothetical protein
MSCYPNNSCNRNVLKSCSNTDVVVYTGENLTCTGVEYGDSLTVVLQKLDEKYCEILNIIENCNTTTTTTTTIDVPVVPPVQVCTSPFARVLESLGEFTPIPPTTTSTTTPTPNLIRLTPANSDGFFGLNMERLSGVNPDNLVFSMQIDAYTASNCTGGSNSYSFNPSLDAGESFDFDGLQSEDPTRQSAKIVSLTVTGGNIITTSPQSITVNGTVYVIEGFNVCTVI